MQKSRKDAERAERSTQSSHGLRMAMSYLVPTCPDAWDLGRFCLSLLLSSLNPHQVIAHISTPSNAFQSSRSRAINSAECCIRLGEVVSAIKYE